VVWVPFEKQQQVIRYGLVPQDNILTVCKALSVATQAPPVLINLHLQPFTAHVVSGGGDGSSARCSLIPHSYPVLQLHLLKLPNTPVMHHPRSLHWRWFSQWSTPWAPIVWGCACRPPMISWTALTLHPTQLSCKWAMLLGT
jgi:hypothetical protein